MAATKPQPAIPILANGEAQTKSCWSCGDMRAAQFCRSCGSVQPPMPTDYFAFFGLDRRLNLDVAALERQMYTLSRRLHPDLYARATPQEQAWSLEQTSKLNDAYRTLRDAVSRTEYLLRIESIRTKERSAEDRQRAVPPDLLEEVFELNEQLEEFRAHAGQAKAAGRSANNVDSRLRTAVEKAKQSLEQKVAAVDDELRRCWNDWDSLPNPSAHEIGVRREPCPEPGADADSAVERHRVLGAMLKLLERRRYLSHLVKETAAALNE